MTARLTVIVPARRGGRDLVRTADALLLQDAPFEPVIVVARDAGRLPLLASVVRRMNARVVESDHETAGINAAVAAAAADLIALVPAGFSPRPACLSRCAAALDAGSHLAAVAPTVAALTADGTGRIFRRPSGPDVGSILADPLAAPGVTMVRRAAWLTAGGFDEAQPMLARLDFWFRLALQPGALHVLDDPLVTRDLEADGGVPGDEPAFLAAFRALVEKHHRPIEQAMTPVFVAQETKFGRLRALHAELVARRDADLAELDRLRAAAAHGRAFLVHHGLGGLDWGDLRRTDPLSRDWGYDRGGPVDRRDIAAFLAAHSSDIRGAVLEVQEDDFTRAFGGPRVTSSDVLDIDAANPRATVIADLRCAPELPGDAYDAIILTQTLHVIDDMPAALRECHRALKPGGVLLATMPAASRVCLEYGPDGDLWRMTPAGARAIAAPIFGAANVECSTAGNVLTNVAFLHGVGSGELTDAEYQVVDPYFPALTGIRASKAVRPLRPAPAARGVVLLYHRIADQDDVHGLAVPPAVFAEHLAWLGANCTVMPLDELLTTPADVLPARAVALTFDDGYLDTLTNGVPLLRAHGMPATFFLTTDGLDAPREFWWDLLERTLLGQAAVPAYVEVPDGPSVQRVSTATPEERTALHWRLHRQLVHATLEERSRTVAAIERWSGLGPAACRPMVADEVRALAAQPGVSIGGHTVHHLALPDQPGDVQRHEVVHSLETLSGLLGRPVTLFAHPYGAIDTASAAVVRATCRWGMSCDERPLRGSFDAARVPRAVGNPSSLIAALESLVPGQ